MRRVLASTLLSSSEMIPLRRFWQASTTRAPGNKGDICNISLIVLDPRMTPIARTADLFIPVRSGGDIGVFKIDAVFSYGFFRDQLQLHTDIFDFANPRLQWPRIRTSSRSRTKLKKPINSPSSSTTPRAGA